MKAFSHMAQTRGGVIVPSRSNPTGTVNTGLNLNGSLTVSY
jgi:hypothetical protein